MPKKGKGVSGVRKVYRLFGVSKEKASRIFWDWLVPFEIAIAILAMINSGFIHG